LAGNFADSLDIPSNDADEPTVVVSVTGTGESAPMPDITVTVSVDPIDDLQLPFGDVWEMFSADQFVMVANDGNADLVIGMIVPPAAPLSIVTDGCSGQILAPTMACVVDLRFNPDTTGTFNDSIDIPSNDPDEATVTVNLNGAGVPPDVGEKLSTEPTGADGGFFGSAITPITLLILLMLMAMNLRRRYG
jgi:hypothetical protein